MIDTRLNKECPCDCDKGCELEDMTQDGHWLCLGSKCEMNVRADERAKIVSMIEEIAHFTLYCMADMCDREDKNCEKCGLEYVIKRIKEKGNE